MIYTVTLNPSLDTTIEVEELLYDDMNRIEEIRKRPGGKGIDVSRVVKVLGGQSIVLGFVGGYNGMELEGNLLNEGIACDFTKIGEESRTNITIFQRKKKNQTLFGSRQPAISPLEVTEIFNKIKEIPEDSFLVLSGNPPEGVNDNFYAQVSATMRGKNVKVILDADGEALKKGVASSPFLVKPNIHEYGRLVGKNIKDVNKILESAEALNSDVGYIVVSMGARGVVGISHGEGHYHVIPPKVKVRSSIGAGDPLVAGLTYSFSQGCSFHDALVTGVACGAASTLNQESGFCLIEDIQKIQKDIIVKRL